MRSLRRRDDLLGLRPARIAGVDMQLVPRPEPGDDPASASRGKPCDGRGCVGCLGSARTRQQRPGREGTRRVHDHRAERKHSVARHDVLIAGLEDGVLVVAEVGTEGRSLFRYDDLLDLEVGGHGLVNTGRRYSGAVSA